MVNRQPQTFGGALSFVESAPPRAFYVATLASIVASAWLFLSGKRWEGIFVGLWAPTFINLGLFFRMLSQTGETNR